MTNTSQLRRILQCAMISTSLTLISDLSAMPAKEEAASSSGSTSAKLQPQDRTEMRTRLYPYFNTLMTKEDAGNFQSVSQGLDDQKLRTFMGEVDTFKTVGAALFSSKTASNALQTMRILAEFYPESEILFPLKGRHDSENLDELQNTWNLIQSLEGESDRTFATQKFYNLTSRIYVNLSDYESFAEIKESYPWLRSFAIDIDRLNGETLNDSILKAVQSENLQGLKFYGAKSLNREAMGISGNVHYTHFDATTQPLDQQGYDRLSTILSKASNKLAHLKFSGVGLDSTQMDGLFGNLLRFKHLKSLAFSHDSMSDESAQNLSKLLNTLKKIEVLHLSHCSLSANGLGALRSQIKKLPLYELKLNGIELNEVSIEHFAKALKNHPTLRNLNLYNLNPDEEPPVFPFTIQGGSQPESEEDEDDDISLEALEKLESTMKTLKLHSLSVSPSVVTDSVFGAVLKSGVGIPSLKQLNFGSNEGDEEVLDVLLMGLPTTSIQLFEGGGTPWKTPQLIKLVEALEQGAPLQELDFAKRPAHPEDAEDSVPSDLAERLANALKTSFVTDLILSNWKFEEPDLLKIVEAASQMPFLTNLGLSNTGVTSRVLQKVLEVMKSKPDFTSLDVARNNLSQEDHALIFDALEEMKEDKSRAVPPEIEHLAEKSHTHHEFFHQSGMGFEYQPPEVEIHVWDRNEEQSEEPGSDHQEESDEESSQISSEETP